MKYGKSPSEGLAYMKKELGPLFSLRETTQDLVGIGIVSGALYMDKVIESNSLIGALTQNGPYSEIALGAGVVAGYRIFTSKSGARIRTAARAGAITLGSLAGELQSPQYVETLDYVVGSAKHIGRFWLGVTIPSAIHFYKKNGIGGSWWGGDDGSGPRKPKKPRNPDSGRGIPTRSSNIYEHFPSIRNKITPRSRLEEKMDA